MQISFFQDWISFFFFGGEQGERFNKKSKVVRVPKWIHLWSTLFILIIYSGLDSLVIYISLLLEKKCQVTWNPFGFSHDPKLD